MGVVVVVVVVVVEMNIIKVALSHFCCRTTVQSDSVSVARQVTVRRWCAPWKGKLGMDVKGKVRTGWSG